MLNLDGSGGSRARTQGFFHALWLKDILPSKGVMSVFKDKINKTYFSFYFIAIVGKWHLGIHSSSNSDFHFHPLKQGFHYFYGLPVSNLDKCRYDLRYDLLDLGIPGLNPTNVLIAGAIIGVTLFICFLNGLISKSVFGFLLTIMSLICFVLTFLLIINTRLNCFVMKDYEIVEQPTILENLTMRFTDEAVDFLRANKDNPFLLYVPFAKVHTPLFNTEPFVNHSIHGPYGDNVEEMDWSVGQIMAAVEELGLKENTFVYFTSDNGASLEKIHDGGGWNGIYKGGKIKRQFNVTC